MSVLASFLSKEYDAILVSGGADGADTAFEKGCNAVKGRKEIWLPEKGFNGRTSEFIGASKDAYIVAERYVGHWKNCKAWARAAHARNCHQVLGADLVTPVSFVIAWTPEGKLSGGTATALSIAMDKGIPILNLGTKDYDEIELWEFLEPIVSV
ncbi:hypothetical protein [Xanthomonas phage BUDD]|nr:hypothetical protein [Xanthomonas phage BUDD]